MPEIHLDPLGGVAGDMFVAALVDLRPDLEPGLHAALANAPFLDGVTCSIEARGDDVLTGRRFHVARTHGHKDGNHDDGHSHHHHTHDTGHGHHEPHAHDKTGHTDHAHVAWQDIRKALNESALDPVTRDHAIGIFSHLADAEARVHGTSPDTVQFHEVGAWDSIADIVAAAWLIAQIGATRWTIGPIPLGSGRIRTAHGLLPVPAPATALLLDGFEIIDDGISGERVTPTGAAIVRYLCAGGDSHRHARKLTGSGHGFGTRSLPGISNCLRALTFETGTASPFSTDRVVVLDCEIDDQTGEDLALAADRLRALEGVLDVLQAPAFGKKGRLMTQLRILTAPSAEQTVVAAVFDETTTLGLRRSEVDRYVLDRELTTVETNLGSLDVKLAGRPSGRTAKAELDDLTDIATAKARKRLRRQAEGPFEDGDQD